MHHLLAPLLAVIVILSPACAAVAGEWYAESAVSQEVEYNDNIGLNADDEVSAWSSQTSPRLRLGGRTENLELALDTQFDFFVFPTEEQLDSNDQRGSLELSYGTHRHLWEVGANFVRNTSRQSEIEDSGARILDNIRREQYGFNGSWQFQATRLDTFTTSAAFSDVSFESDELIGSETVSGGLGWARLLTETTSIDAQARAAHFEPDRDGARKSTGFGVEGGITHSFSPRWQSRTRGGVRIVRSETLGSANLDSDTSTDVGSLIDLSLAYLPAERTTVRTSFLRSLEPSSSGELRERNEIDLSVAHQWSHSVGLGLAARFQRQTGIDDQDDDDRKFFSISPSVRWRLTDDWELRSVYTYRRQSFDDDEDSAAGNVFSLLLTYRAPIWSSRP